LLLPTVAVPKLTLVGVAAACAWAPVPLNPMVSGDPGALLAIETVPVADEVPVGLKVTLKEAVWPGLSVWGASAPIEKEEPVRLDPLMETDPVPVFLSVTFVDAFWPTATLPKLRLDGFALKAPWACVPVPLRPIVKGDPGALLVIETLPVAAEPFVGANVTLKDAVWPGFRVWFAKVDIVKTEPLTLAPVIETCAVPEFVIVTVEDVFWPTATLGKLTLDGLAFNAPCAPAPLKLILRGDPGAVLAIETLPVAGVPFVGVNVTLNDALCPGDKVWAARADMANPAPVTPDPVIETEAVPEFVSVIDDEEFWPTATLPKLTLEGLALKPPCTPVPLKAIVRGEPGALFVIEMIPFCEVVLGGLNVTLKEAVWPGPRLWDGSVDIVKPAPLIPEPEIETGAFPVLVRVIVDDEFCPTLMLPKLTLEGFAVSAPCVPIPSSGTVTFEFVALLTKVKLPLAWPLPTGVNFTWTEALCPAGSDVGVAEPISENPSPETVMLETSVVAVPVFVTSRLCVVLAPTCMFPKFKEAVLVESTPDFDSGFVGNEP
jgi:hypothetical protein